MYSSVRTRLTVWYIGVLALVLVSFSVGVYVMLKRSLYAQFDYDLKNTVEGTSGSFVRVLAAGKDPKQAAIDQLDDRIGPDQSAAIFDSDGKPIAENPDLAGVRVQLPNALSGGPVDLFTIAEGSGRRVVMKRF